MKKAPGHKAKQKAKKKTFATIGTPIPTQNYVVPVDNDVSVSKILKQYSSSPRRASFCTLFGQRQAGKSTRLRSLNETLEGQGFTVVYLDMRQVLTEPTEFYATLAGAMALGFPEHHRIDAEEMASLLHSLPTTVAGLQSYSPPSLTGCSPGRRKARKESFSWSRRWTPCSVMNSFLPPFPPCS